MNTQKFDLRKLALILYAGLLFILPVFILPATIPVYGPIFKGMIFKFFVVAICLTWVASILFSGKRPKDEGNFRYNSLFLFLFSGLILLSLSAVSSIYPRQAIFGSYIEQEGLIVTGLYVLSAFIFYQFRFRVSELRHLADVAIAAASIVSSIAILQYFFGIGVLYEGFGSGLTDKLRPTSTLGNPVYMASYLVMIFPLALAQAFLRDKTILYYFRIASVFLISLGLLISFTRGSWLAMLAEVLILLTLIGAQRLKKNKNALLNIGIALMLAMIIFIPQLSVKSADIASSVTGGEGALSGGSIGTRLIMWDGALKMIDSAPLSGYGPDSVQYSYPYYGGPELYLAEGYGSVTRVHNDFLQSALHGGMLAVLLYLFILTFTLMLCIRVRKANMGDPGTLLLGIGAAIIGYALNNFSAFSVIAVVPSWWVLIGMLATFASATGALTDRSARLPINVVRTLAGLLVVSGAIYLGLMLKQVGADLNDSRSIMSFKQGEPEKALENAKLAAQSYPYESHYRATLANTYYNLAPIPGYPDPLQALGEARKILEGVVAENPYNIAAVTNLGNIYYALGSMDDKKYYNDAEKYYLMATKLNPIYEKNFAFLGNTYYFLGEKEKAKKYYEIAISLDPKSEEAVKGLIILGREAGLE